MNNEEMRKMWEEAANRNKRMEANNNALEHPNTNADINKPRGHPPRGTDAAAARQARIKKQSELYAIRKSSRSAKPSPKTDEYQYRMGDMIDRITDGPKTEETP